MGGLAIFGGFSMLIGSARFICGFPAILFAAGFALLFIEPLRISLMPILRFCVFYAFPKADFPKAQLACEIFKKKSPLQPKNPSHRHRTPTLFKKRRGVEKLHGFRISFAFQAGRGPAAGN